MPDRPQLLTLGISSMTCGHCVAAVTEALGSVPGITVQQVSIGSATVALDPDAVSSDKVIAAVREAGYAAEVRSSSPDASAPSRSA